MFPNLCLALALLLCARPASPSITLASLLPALSARVAKCLSPPSPDALRRASRAARGVVTETALSRDPEWRSQLGQDRFVACIANYTRGGVFFEAGAADGVALSNTFALERALGWTGVLVEAAVEFAEALPRSRGGANLPPGGSSSGAGAGAAAGADAGGAQAKNAIFTRLALWSLDGERLRFQSASLMGGVESALGDDSRRAIAGGLPKEARPVYFVTTARVSTLLDRAGLRVVDFMSLDLEGGELEALRGVDWARHRVNVLCVEDNRPGSPESLDVCREVAATGRFSTPIAWQHDLFFVAKDLRWSWEG